MADVSAALEAWEADLAELALSGIHLGYVLRMCGLMQLLPVELGKDMTLFKSTLTNYPAARTWIIEQVAARRGTAGTHDHEALRSWRGSMELESSQRRLRAAAWGGVRAGG